MGGVQTDNRHLGTLSGFGTRWIHNDGSKNTTVTPKSGQIVVLHRIIVNTTAASAIIIRDSAVGVIATMKASIAEGTYAYNLPVKGNLVVEVGGASDVTIVYSNN